jgi:hypothetical protein
LVNTRGDLIAALGITRSRDTSRRMLDDALPPELLARPRETLFGEAGARLVGRRIVLLAQVRH